MWGERNGGRRGRPVLHLIQGQTGNGTTLENVHLGLPPEVPLRRRHVKEGRRAPGEDWGAEGIGGMERGIQGAGGERGGKKRGAGVCVWDVRLALEC